MVGGKFHRFIPPHLACRTVVQTLFCSIRSEEARGEAFTSAARRGAALFRGGVGNEPACRALQGARVYGSRTYSNTQCHAGSFALRPRPACSWTADAGFLRPPTTRHSSLIFCCSASLLYVSYSVLIC